MGCVGGQADQGQSDDELRIVSLNPCADAILADIAPEHLVAVSYYSLDPRSGSMDIATARRFESTSGTVEEIIALRPSVVVASTFIAPTTAQALERLDIRVERIGIAATVEDSVDQVRKLASLSGNPDAGAELIDRMTSSPAPAGNHRPSALLWQTGGIVAGEGSLVARMLERAGFANHAAMRGLGQGAYLPLEQVLADPPDVIIAAGGERTLTHPALRALPDVHYAALDPALLYCGGPTIPKLAARLREIKAQIPRAGGDLGQTKRLTDRDPRLRGESGAIPNGDPVR